MPVEAKLSHTAAMVLQAIHAGHVYGFSVMEVTGLPSGTVYPAMRRLERGSLIVSKWEQQSIADAEQRPPRKYYRLTRTGRSMLEAAWRRYPLLERMLPSAQEREGMRPKATKASALARMLIWLASRIVPRGTRCDWAAEWNAELCHICQSPAGNPVRFSLGAFQDAFWLRLDGVRSRALVIFPAGSAPRCLLGLAVLAICGFLMCMFLPGARRALSAAPYRNPADLVIISSNGYRGTLTPGIAMSDYREWKTDTRHLFSQIAYYKPVLSSVRLGERNEIKLSVGLASENLLRVLDFVRQDLRQPVPGEQMLILSQTAWAIHFGSDPDLIGRSVLIAGQPAIIAGILPDREWRLPGGMDALLVGNAHPLAALPGTARGFVIARLREPALLANHHGWRQMFEVRNGIVLHFACIPFSYLFGQPLSIFLFSLLMACVSLPATTPLRTGDYSERQERLPGSLRIRRWTFLLAKLLLVFLAAGFWSVALAYGFSAAGSSAFLYIQMGTSFPSLLIALRWMLHDQRRRCPVCLRILSNPARVGQPSCNFLSWCGTELVCLSGHGLLHIPELPTSWFGAQRWLCLDASWASLFPTGCS